MSEYSDIVSDGKMDPRWSRQTNLKDIPHPAKSQWQGLTDAEIEEFENMELGTHDLCLEIEAKLQEKNT